MRARGMKDLFGDASYDLYDGNPPSQRHSSTSKAAAQSIVKRIGPLHLDILDFLQRSGLHGATDEEMQRELKMPANTQRPRRVELVQMLRIKDSGITRLTTSKRHAVVWIICWP